MEGGALDSIVKVGRTAYAVLILLAAPLCSGAAAQESARDLVQRLLAAAPRLSFTAKGALTTVAGTREFDLQYKPLGDAGATYLEVTAPKDVKGTRFLFLERATSADEQFVYVPIARRTIRISEETRNQPFLGSDFAVSDMVKSELDAYTYSLVGEAEVGGRRCTLIEMVAKDAASDLYSKRIAAVDAGDLILLRTEFFDAQGKLVKVWTVEDLQKVDGVWTPMQQRMTNVQENKQSRIVLTEIKYRVDLPDHIFTRNYIDRRLE
jgi:outer membrane lipoprotein-sorting protein